MITKLTAENAELYYAPRFAEITAAFKAAGSNIEIKSLEDYFYHITDIAALSAGAKNVEQSYLLVLPADEDIFTIDANTRAISVPAFVKKNGIGVYGDHQAEMIVMTIDRYFDHEDFLNDNFVINWNFTPAGARTPIYPENQAAMAFAPNEELNPGLITFGFIITKDMTPSKGTLTFSVTIYDAKSDEIIYSFNTLTASVNINDTLTLTNLQIIENEANRYVNRLMNSVYTNNTISPVGKPFWVSNSGKGLQEYTYLPAIQDLTNVYDDGVLLTARANVDPSTADLVYKWTCSPVDGTVDTVREFDIVNKFSDYIEVELPESDDNSVYYTKDAIGHINTIEPLSWTEAKAKEAEAAHENPYLPVKVRKLQNAPNDINQVNSQFNQDNLDLISSGNIIIATSKQELRSFESTNASQNGGKWIAFDIDTGLDSIVGVKWNNSDLTVADEEEAASVGLPSGHIVFWAKAELLNAVARTIKLDASGYDTTKIIFQYSGIDETRTGVEDYIEIVNSPSDIKFVVRGTSYLATAAGKYQVTAQAKVGAGENYEQVLAGAELKAGVQYFLKDANNEIDKLNPLVNEAALTAQNEGKQLFVLVSAARNSEPTESNVLIIPPAVVPNVTLSVASEYEFSDEIQKDVDFEGPEYVYIDDNNIPTILATVTVPSDNNEDKAGAFATELVTSETPDLTVEEINNKIIQHELNFQRLPEDGKFEFHPANIEEGEYIVRAINRRNHTYSVSAPSESIHTSFVAPAITDLTVQVLDNGEVVKTVLDAGLQTEEGLINLELNKNLNSYKFVIIDNSENKSDAIVSYYIEEVEYDQENNTIIPREETGIDPDTGRPYEYYGEPDIREIIRDENNILSFTITDDPGYYRIKTINRYHGTIHTAYTELFGVVSH